MSLSKIPASITEQLPAKYLSENPDDMMVIEIVETTKALREAAEQIRDTTEAALADPMRAPAARAKRARDAGFDLLKRATRKVDATQAKASKMLEAISAALAGPPAAKDAATIMVQSELRGVLRAMPDAKRAQAIADAIERNDTDVLAAYLHGNPLASGASPTEKEMRRLQWAQRHHAAELARVERIKGAVAHMQQAAGLTITWVDGLTSASEIERAMAEAERADELVRKATPVVATT